MSRLRSDRLHTTLQNQVKRHLSAEALGPAEAARLRALSTPPRADPAVHSRPAGVGNPMWPGRPARGTTCTNSRCSRPAEPAGPPPASAYTRTRTPVTLRPAILKATPKMPPRPRLAGRPRTFSAGATEPCAPRHNSKLSATH